MNSNLNSIVGKLSATALAVIIAAALITTGSCAAAIDNLFIGWRDTAGRIDGHGSIIGAVSTPGQQREIRSAGPVRFVVYDYWNIYLACLEGNRS